MTKRINKTRSFFLLKESLEPDFGFTTGTCAAAASMASARMLLTGKSVPYVILTTPKGIKVCIEIENQKISKNEASCSVEKFSGSDSDVTNGIKIFSIVRKIFNDSEEIKITAGCGVGKVTLPGLDQNVGEAAINRVPRKMILNGIKSELEKNLKKTDRNTKSFSLEVEISAPGGEEIAKQTFNPKLGIIGGISILGTSGIVEPMSEQAILDTIQVEMNVRKAEGFKILPLVPGNYGADFLKKNFDFSVEKSVHCSNFIYDSLQMAEKSGFTKIFFCGHIGKLIKVCGGVKNTHSRYGDKRMEILSEIAKEFVSENLFLSLSKQFSECISTEQAVNILDSFDSSSELRGKIMQEIALRIQNQMNKWTENKIQTEVMIFTNEHGLLGYTEKARDFIKELSGNF